MNSEMDAEDFAELAIYLSNNRTTKCSSLHTKLLPLIYLNASFVEMSKLCPLFGSG